MSRIRVLVADDHAVLRSGLKLLIGSQPDMLVVAEARSFEEALLKAKQQPVDVATLDLTMPGLRSVRSIQQFVSENPQTRVLILTMHDEPDFVRAALAAGATGYVVKDVADVELIGAIRAVFQGRTFVDAASDNPGSARSRPSSGLKDQAAVAALETLSLRERTVLRLVALGHTNREISDRFVVSVKTVESYRARVMAKLGLRNRAELVQYAVDSGLLRSHADEFDDSDGPGR